jgi:alpha-tubulin suppressor-like RCC1 family protein
VWCWGKLGYGASDPVPREIEPARGAVELAGQRQLCARFADGSAKCGFPPTTIRLDGLVSLSQSASHTAGVTVDGGVISIGAGYFGQFGDGDAIEHSAAPVRAKDLEDAVAVVTTEYTSCVLRRGGTVACMGRDVLGENMRTTPATVPGIEHATAIALGVGAGCALITDGTVRCWGDSDQGQAGPHGRPTATKGQPIAGLADVVQIAATHRTFCARRRAGTVACWGANWSGLMDLIPLVDWVDHPVEIAVTDAVDVSLDEHACVVRATGEVMCWGNSQYGTLGELIPPNDHTPVQVQFGPLR